MIPGQTRKRTDGTGTTYGMFGWASGPPGHLKASAKTIERFPMPGKIVDEVSEATLKDGLRRWQREDGYFSGYIHAGFRKMMPRHIASTGDFTTTQKEEVVEKKYDRLSWSATWPQTARPPKPASAVCRASVGC